MSSDEKSLKSAIEEVVALEEAGNLEESLCKWKEIRAVKDTPNAALRHGCLARELKKWDEAELAGLQACNSTEPHHSTHDRDAMSPLFVRRVGCVRNRRCLCAFQ